MTGHQAPPLTVTHASDADGPTILAAGELDLSTVESLVDAAHRQLEGTPARLTLDLAGITFCDSAGINGLVKVRNAYVGQGWAFRMTNLTPDLRRVIVDLTGLGEFLAVEAA